MSKDVKLASGRLLVGSCLDRLKELDAASVDSIVTDPPYELSFMGKSWDGSGVAYQVELWAECLRVLKPGGHLLAFGGTRTYHRMVVAIEDAGFEVRDSIHWTYGSGFPKSLDVSKAIDKAAGAEREVVGSRTLGGTAASGTPAIGTLDGVSGVGMTKDVPITAPATDDAAKWQGWGTALKPSHEPIVIARKPLDGTVAANVLAYGTGGLNIDGCRVGTDDTRSPASLTALGQGSGWNSHENRVVMAGSAYGRWPANTVLTHAADCGSDCAPGCPVAALDQQHDGASRFFAVTEWEPQWDDPILYVAKPSKRERNAGLDGLPEKQGKVNKPAKSHDKNKTETGTTLTFSSQNFHPTVKPVALMRHLVRLVTPPGGTVLDPFLGSGTTAVAAVLEELNWIGCEMTTDYLPIVKGRVRHAQRERAKQQPPLPSV